jgi:hypothetical protein
MERNDERVQCMHRPRRRYGPLGDRRLTMAIHQNVGNQVIPRLSGVGSPNAPTHCSRRRRRAPALDDTSSNAVVRCAPSPMRLRRSEKGTLPHARRHAAAARPHRQQLAADPPCNGSWNGSPSRRPGGTYPPPTPSRPGRRVCEALSWRPGAGSTPGRRRQLAFVVFLLVAEVCGPAAARPEPWPGAMMPIMSVRSSSTAPSRDLRAAS